jgi:hypothetical protein
MKKQIKLTESELHSIIEGAVKNLLKEYDPHMAGLGAARGLEQGKIGPWNAAQKIMNRDRWNSSQRKEFQNGFERKPIQQSEENLEEYSDAEMAQGMNIYGRPSYDEHEFDDFNEQPVNNIAAESKQYKVNESQLHQIIKESVLRVLKESGETHRFGQGKYGLAMDAASKAKSLGRYEQSANLTRHGADAFNQQYGTPDFEMDEYGQLRHRSDTGKERLYRPNSVMNRLKSNVGLQGGKDALHSATINNSFIRDAARTAKAFPRKKMTGGLDAIDAVDAGLHGDE